MDGIVIRAVGGHCAVVISRHRIARRISASILPQSLYGSRLCRKCSLKKWFPVIDTEMGRFPVSVIRGGVFRDDFLTVHTQWARHPIHCQSHPVALLPVHTQWAHYPTHCQSHPVALLPVYTQWAHNPTHCQSHPVGTPS